MSVTIPSSDVPVATIGAPTPQPPRIDPPHGVDVGLIAGTVVGAVVTAALLVYVVVLLLSLRRRSKSYQTREDKHPNDSICE